MSKTIPWSELSQAYAFLGNSLLSPMLSTSDAGMSLDFWDAFPRFGSARVDAACLRCAEAVAAFAARGQALGRDAVELASTEFTRLFIGPPSPAAAPWESFYRSESGNPVGFGPATYEMQDLLRASGLEVRNENNQYADHIGLELLFLSEMCRRRAEDEGSSNDSVCGDGAILRFLQEHPLGWMQKLQAAVQHAAPGGYIDGVLGVAWALCRLLEDELAAGE